MMIPSHKNSQVPTSINVIERKWKPLHSTIQYCICNILPFFCMIFDMLFVGHDVAQS
jgi:hypothetical protein